MITQYFDTNARLIIQAPGSLAPATQNAWVYGDNYNLAIYLVAQGAFLAIGPNDILGLMLFQEQANNPQQELAIIGPTAIQTDPSGNQYYFVNVNLKTTPLAGLVQTPNKAQTCQFHYTFKPAAGERFSSSADISIVVNPDPTESATGATPVPPGYPTNPSVFEQIANKNIAGGYAGLDGNADLNPNQIPTDTTLAVTGGKLTVIGGGSGGGNPYIAVIPASFTIGAVGSNTTVTLGAATPDITAAGGQGILITDGVNFINGIVQSFNKTTFSLVFENILVSGSGTMAANSHVYMGNAAALATTTIPGLVAVLSGNANTFLNGTNAFSAVPYSSLSGLPSTFPPSVHGSQHIPTGIDPVPLVTPTVGGLCPPIDNSTITIIAGKLTAHLVGGGNAWVATISGSPAIPAAGATSGAYTLSNTGPFAVGQSVLITDGTLTLNGIIASYTPATPSITVRNLGSTNGSVSGNFAATAYVFPGNVGDLASSTTPGIVRPDGSTITIAAGVLTAAPPAGIIGKIGFRMRATSGQAFASGTQAVCQFNVTNWDTSGFISGTAPNLVATVPSAQYGVYLITGCISWPPTVGGTFRKTFISLNTSGSMELAAVYAPPPPASYGQAAYIQTVTTIAYIGVTPPNGTDITWPGIANTAIYLMGLADVALTTAGGQYEGQACLMAQRIA